MTPQVAQAQARRLLLAGQGLLGPARGLTQVIDQLGYVQLDSINSLARAHELTLHARCPGYRHESLFSLLAQRRIFEHWTHDASSLSAQAWPYWGRRFEQRRQKIHASAWWRERLGAGFSATLDRVRDRLQDEGPLQSRDFVSSEKSSAGWWNWRPEKAALEYLWHCGEITVTARQNFQKVYHLTQVHLGPPSTPDPALAIDWACFSALQRLGVATPSELAAYWGLVDRHEALAWGREAASQKRVQQVLDNQGRAAFARPDYGDLAAQLKVNTRSIRLLAPFDPVLRDRKRAVRLFNFDFRFEAFVPAQHRKHGYYSLPILEGESLVGRISPKIDRKQALLHVPPPHWESGLPPSPARLRRLQQALQRLADFLEVEYRHG